MAHSTRARARARRPWLTGAFLLGLAAAAASLGVVSGRAPSPISTPPPEAFQPFAQQGLRGVPSISPGSVSEASGPVSGAPLVPTVVTVPSVPTVPAVTGTTPSTAPSSFAPGWDAPRPTALPTPTPDAPTVATPPPGPSHVVRAGESLWSIAVAHGVPPAIVVRWNPKVDPSSLRIGSTILVPGGRAMVSRRAIAPTPKAAPKPKAAPTPKAAPRPRPVVRPRPAAHWWPLAVRGMITTRFSSWHPGIDIAAPAGTPVHAVAAGVVVWAGWKDNGGGFVVVVQHRNGMISTYNHNRRVLVTVGERVQGGEQIAEVGATGNATGPHLDFRIEMGGRFVDPLLLL
ncbi:MAG: peptidoglycan DD-metalloendopeptidase family protein [Candidatus Limnocylindrales bacterium]